MTKQKRQIVLIAGGAALLAGVVILWLALRDPPEATDGEVPAVRVLRGPLLISVTEGGEVEAERKRIISNELTWPVIIKKVVPEGTLVKEGDVIIEFECKELMEAITQEKLKLTEAEAEHLEARENLDLKKEEMRIQVNKARQDVIDAEADLKRYEEGEWPVLQGEAKSAIDMAKRDLALAEEKLTFKLQVNQDPDLNSPYSKNEIEADQLSVDRLKNSLAKAISERDMLVKYDHPRKQRKLALALEDAQVNDKRASLEAEKEIRKAEATEKAKKETLETRRTTLKELEEQAAKLVVKAEKSGLVVYDTGRGRRGGTDVVVMVGEKINPNQRLMMIPDMSSLQVSTKVYEALVDQVKPGVPVVIRLDAKQRMALKGHIDKVAPLPDSQNRWLNPGVKIYNVTVAFDDSTDGLKPGMTANVEMMLARLENVLSVPVACVFTEQEKTYCYRRSWGKAERVAVKVGRMSDTRVQIAEGLKEGDEVLLGAPADHVRKSSEKDGQGRKGKSQPAASGNGF